MPQPCSICTRPEADRKQIDQALISGRPSLRDTAVQFGTSKSALARHKAHLSTKMIATAERKEAVHVEALVDDVMVQIRDYDARIADILDRCVAAGDLRSEINALREARELTKLRAQLTGKLTTGSQIAVGVNVNTAPSLLQSVEWPILMQVLSRHKEIHDELTTALHEAGL